ncbi:selenide, water dikinase [Desulfomarina profundi]|uniref:Selenide, water dikinase n=2 Tax=Desulfomarina profundi TaxID=2772557 RepID=A0A8D5JNF1_9BACT|nr:selenide, water dikinase [Desulfomarina profundi]
MGGVPKTAMNLVAFPGKEMDLSILRAIIEGGIDKLKEAEVVLMGGHSVEDKEIKFGLSVTGIIHPRKILAKKNLRPGDRLILTKPLGTGIINTAIKAAMAPAELCNRVTRIMATLNRRSGEIMEKFDISACTDITGFGLLGHLAEMVCGSGNSVTINSGDIPLIPEAIDFANMGFVPAGAYNNRTFREEMITFNPQVPRTLQDILFDPQTSGGLLISVQENQAEKLLNALKEGGVEGVAQIGEIVSGPKEKIEIK